jgi:hypothetical protein
MVKKSKHIGVYFMWMAMLVIIGHSVVPHHHHSDVVSCQQTCDHGNNTEHGADPISKIVSLTGHQCETSHHHGGCESCQFETTATTSLSKIVIHYSFFASFWLQLTVLPESPVVYFDSWSNHYSFDFSGHTSSRGPPALG